jgi:hypothetical protein
MSRVMFFNYYPQGLGGLWQNISWLLCNQTEPLEINLHLDEYNVNRFKEILNCFSEPKYPITVKIKNVLHYDVPADSNWYEATKIIINHIQSKTDYSVNEIQTVSCALHHDYWPIKQKRNISNYVCTYLRYTDENKIKPRPIEYNIDRDLTIEQADSVYNTLTKHNIDYIELGPNYSLLENCQLISQAKFIIGREGGWTHVANSARVDYYPVMNNRHYFLDTCHGDQNKYLKEYTHVDNFEFLLRNIL